jgi:ferredoxin--NADP+ reductase/benzoate/toluate 1,2-dioxygenase reductase subunit
MQMREHQIRDIRHLTEDTFIIRMDRNGFQFEPGQHIHVGIRNDYHCREYSIYSPVTEDYLEILVKLVPEGYLTPRLSRLKPGDILTVEGPFGYFTVSGPESDNRYYLIATGTGVAPFHCITGSHPALQVQIFHGVRNLDDCYESGHYPQNAYFSCVSREDGGFYRGRVTGYFQDIPADPGGIYYLCGNSNMIYEMFDLLKTKGITSSQIKAEVYF